MPLARVTDPQLFMRGQCEKFLRAKLAESRATSAELQQMLDDLPGMEKQDLRDLYDVVLSEKTGSRRSG